MLRYIMIAALAATTLSACNSNAGYPPTHHRKTHTSMANAKLVHFKDGRVGFHSPDNDMLWYYIYLNNNNSATMPTSSRTFATFPSANTSSAVQTALNNGTARIDTGRQPEPEELAEASSLDENLGEIASESGVIQQEEQALDIADAAENGSEAGGSAGSDSGSSSGDSGSSSGDSGGGGGDSGGGGGE